MHIIGPERWWAGGSVGLSLPTLREVGSTVCGTPRGGGSTMGPIQLGAEGSLGLAGEARPKEGGRGSGGARRGGGPRGGGEGGGWLGGGSCPEGSTAPLLLLLLRVRGCHLPETGSQVSQRKAASVGGRGPAPCAFIVSVTGSLGVGPP